MSELEIDECLVQGALATSSYLKKLSSIAISAGLPVPLAAQWSLKGLSLKREYKTQETIGDNVDKCYNCGFSFRNPNSFRIVIKAHNSGNRQVLAVCRGCDANFQCGALNNSAGDESVLCPTTAISPVKSISYPTPKQQAPTVQSRAANLECSSQKKRCNKRRGSALEKLMKAEESEADRSLSAFLNSFSS